MSEDEFPARYGGLFLVGFEDETTLLHFQREECKVPDGGWRFGQHITRGIVLAARKEGKLGISIGRYGDSPERNGVPAKGFAVVADTAEKLEAHLARYEPMNSDLAVAVDDTLCKGMESWACYGLQPINRLTGAGGTVFVTSMQTADALLTDCHRKGAEATLGVIPGTASFSGLRCPDSCFDVTPTGHYNANMEACCGCGVCEAGCPVKDCITMGNEQAFGDNSSQFAAYEKDPAAYKAWVTEKITDKTITARSHGFRYRGQCENESTEAARVRTRARQGTAREGRHRWKSSRAGWRERGCGLRWSR